jgi:phosphoglycolate phosphatase
VNCAVTTILFDFEGTLVDFQWRLDEAEAEAAALLKKHKILGGNRLRIHYARAMNRALEHRQRTGQGQVVSELALIYDRYDADALRRWQVRPGVHVMLQEIRTWGLKTGLVSNVGRKNLDSALEKLSLRSGLDTTVSRDEALWLKPHPGGILLALERLDCLEPQALFIGDSLDDVSAARQAGLQVMIITGGQHPLRPLQKAAPEGIFKDWKELLLRLRGLCS